MFEAGRDIVVYDPPPGKEGWTIQTVIARSLLRNQAVSTSGDTEQLSTSRRRYSHVVDPRTGIGLPSTFMATVIAPRGIASDSLSKRSPSSVLSPAPT